MMLQLMKHIYSFQNSYHHHPRVMIRTSSLLMSTSSNSSSDATVRRRRRIAVIGGGASGMFAATAAADASSSSCEVIVFEGTSKLCPRLESVVVDDAMSCTMLQNRFLRYYLLILEEIKNCVGYSPNDSRQMMHMSGSHQGECSSRQKVMGGCFQLLMIHKLLLAL